MPQPIQRCEYCGLEWTAEEVEDILFCREDKQHCSFYDRQIHTAINLPARTGEVRVVESKSRSWMAYLAVALLIGLLTLAFMLFQTGQEKDLMDNRLILATKEKERLESLIDQYNREGGMTKETEELHDLLNEKEQEIDDLKLENRKLKRNLKGINAEQAVYNEPAPSTNNSTGSSGQTAGTSPATAVVTKFINYLGKQQFQAAYELQSIDNWGDANFFASEKSFGGVKTTQIYSTQVESEDEQEATISVDYFSEDPTNDPNTIKRLELPCEGSTGLVYRQLFNLKKSGGQWKIVGTKLLNRKCS